MKQFNFLISVGFFCFVLISSCKEDEPFEYPEDLVDIEPTWIVEVERQIDSNENWISFQQSEGCDPTINVNNLAYYELNYSRGFATIQLIPNDSLCQLQASLESHFKPSEISNFEWNELHFQYTFSEFKASANTEYWLWMSYKNVDLKLDLAPVIKTLIPSDTTDGLVEMYFFDGEPRFEINGKPFNPNFDEGSPNSFSSNGSSTDAYFKVGMTSRETSEQSFTIFKYLRITRFGIPEA